MIATILKLKVKPERNRIDGCQGCVGAEANSRVVCQDLNNLAMGQGIQKCNQGYIFKVASIGSGV